MADSCESCRFCAAGDGRFPSALECRRHPPVNGGRRPVAEWPHVYPDSWCGEFEARPATPRAAAKKRPAAGSVETRSESS